MAPGKRSSARRKQNVDAAKKSYEQKKAERSSLHEDKSSSTYNRLLDAVRERIPKAAPEIILKDFEKAAMTAFREKFQSCRKNQMLLDQQMAILHEMARLEEEARMWEDACNSIMHTCEQDFSLAVERPACYDNTGVVMVDEEGDEQLIDYGAERIDITYQQEGDDQTALDLSLKTLRAIEDSGILDSSETAPPRFEAHTSQEESAPQRLEPQAQQRYEVIEIEYSTLDIGATQEVELKVQRNRKSKRVTFDESMNSVKNYKNDIFTPPMCTTVH